MPGKRPQGNGPGTLCAPAPGWGRAIFLPLRRLHGGRSRFAEGEPRSGRSIVLAPIRRWRTDALIACFRTEATRHIPLCPDPPVGAFFVLHHPLAGGTVTRGVQGRTSEPERIDGVEEVRRLERGAGAEGLNSAARATNPTPTASKPVSSSPHANDPGPWPRVRRRWRMGLSFLPPRNRVRPPAGQPHVGILLRHEHDRVAPAPSSGEPN